MICLDSDLIIDFLKGKKEAVDAVNKYDEEVVTTEINKFEVFVGIYLKENFSEKEEKIAQDFFESLEVLSFESNCAETSAKIFTSLVHKGKEIDQNDCLIASIVLENGIDGIITRNDKHFSLIKGLSVVKY